MTATAHEPQPVPPAMDPEGKDLGLPPMEEFRLNGHASLYGAAHVAARYCGIRAVPSVRPRGLWKHGWTPEHWPFHPSFLMGCEDDLRDFPGAYFLVARPDEERRMREAGYPRTRAIGLPITYVPDGPPRRRPGSLLVMPAHSVEDTRHAWRFDAYAEEIERIRPRFSEVVVCVHPACWKQGYWVPSFQSRGFRVIKGALVTDRHALVRMHTLFSTFEHVTTNGFGSHLAYGAYLGAKVSIYGTYAEYTAEDNKDDRIFKALPHLLEPAVREVSFAEVRRRYADFFCHPADAPLRVEWGRHQVGADHRVSPRELRTLLGWRLVDQVMEPVLAGARRRVPAWAKRGLRRLASFRPSR